MTRIALLGRPAVQHADGSTVAPRGVKAWALLAYLLLADHPAPRSRLASLLFPDAADPAATLRWNLAELRRTLGPEVALGGDPVSLHLDDTWHVDVLALHRGGWEEAVALPHLGRDLLEGVVLDGVAGFGLWLDAERRHVHQMSVGLLTDGARALLARGEGHEALTLTRRLLEVAPHDEPSHVLHVRVVAEVEGTTAGRTALADAAAFLARELDTPPSRALARALDGTLGSPRATSGPATVLAQLEAGRAAVAAGVAGVGIESLSRAVVGARATGDRHLLATALLEVGSALVHAARGTDVEGAGALHEAAALALELGIPTVAATAHRELGYVEMLQGDYVRAAWWLGRAEEHADGDDGEQAWIEAVRSHARLDVGHHEQARRAGRAALALAERAGQPRVAAFALASLGRGAVLRHELDEADALLDEAVARARSEAWHAFVPWPEAFQGEAELLAGRIDRADELFGHAYAMGRQLDDPCWESVAARGLGLVAAARGDRATALGLLEEAPRSCRRLPDSYRWVEGYGLEALAATATAVGSPSAARWAQALVRFASDRGMRELQVHGLRHQAALGLDGAAELADTLVAGIDNPALAARQPPAMAPTTRKGSSPAATAGGSGSSGDSWDRSSWPA